MKHKLCLICGGSRFTSLRQDGRIEYVRCQQCGCEQFFIEHGPADQPRKAVRFPLEPHDLENVRVSFSPHGEEPGVIEFNIGPCKLALVEHFTSLPEREPVNAWIIRRHGYVILQCLIGDNGFAVPITRIEQQQTSTASLQPRAVS